MPTSTDLVTDLPADFAVFGQGVDTTMAGLKGGTTGQILSKTSATDMAFTWIANDQGDITGVTAGTGISGGGTSGAVTITNDMATTITTAGDLIKGTGSGTYSRLGIGSTGQVLTVSGGAPVWSTAASGALVYITTTTFTSASVLNFNSIFSSTYDSYKVIIKPTSSSAGAGYMRLRVSGADNSTGNYNNAALESNSGGVANRYNASATSWFSGGDIGLNDASITLLEFHNPYATSKTWVDYANGGVNTGARMTKGILEFDATTSFDGFSIIPSSGNLSGTMTIYGYAKS
ncbi:hypothetical protein UFOVP1406_11 [uncultured Caudovirales phage]|uniref:Uncharacterized protein n=1 Tax=uncultured Caudovirales phage TaxID=2100421 RepID=A0A6J5S847_9CAUD|nr:hypothetical protein UFOVP1406_11 [uncultured Caudovirales phage]